MLPHKISDLRAYSFVFYTISNKFFFQNLKKIELKKKKKVEIFTIDFFLTDSSS